MFYGAHCDTFWSGDSSLPGRSLGNLLTSVCLCLQEFCKTADDVGGMAARWLARSPPKSLHVSPGFHRPAFQVDRIAFQTRITFHKATISAQYQNKGRPFSYFSASNVSLVSSHEPIKYRFGINQYLLPQRKSKFAPLCYCL